MVFELLLRQPISLNRTHTVENLRRFDRVFAQARIDAGAGLPESPFLLVIRGKRIALSAFAEPLPENPDFEASLQAAHYDHALKAAAKEHRAYLRAEWLAQEPLNLDAMVLLAGVMGAFSSSNALVVVHAAAHASLPAATLQPVPINGERLPIIRSYPLGLLFVGFIKYEIEGREGIWMASHNAALLGLPEFAMQVPDHSWGETVLDIFDRLQRHALQSGATFAAGDTAKLSRDLTLRFEQTESPLEFMSANRSWLIVNVI